MKAFRHQYFVPLAVLKQHGWPKHTPYTEAMATGVMVGAGPERVEGKAYPWPIETIRGTWQQSQAGWWVRNLPQDPGEMLRLDCTGLGCRPVETTRGVWLVRQILRPDRTCALPMPYGVLPDGTYGLQVAPEYQAITERARTFLIEVSERADAADGHHWILEQAAAFLAMSYHVSIHELALGAYLTPGEAIEICSSACGITTADVATLIDEPEPA